MIVEDIKAAQLDNTDALFLSLDLLRNKSAVARFSEGLDLMEERRSLTIPPDEQGQTRKQSAPLYSLAFMVAATPPGSFPHRFGILTNQTRSTGDIQLMQQLLSDVLQDDQQGAINCLLVARTFGNQEISRQVARTGLERLSTAEFEHDIAPLINQPCYVREAACSLLAWLQQSSDEDVERIVRVAALYLKDQEDRPISIRPLLTLIRSQRDKTPEEVLASLPPVIWKGGLRRWVKSSLQETAGSAPETKKSYFNAASESIPDWRGFRAETTQAKKKLNDGSTDRKMHVKPASRARLLENLPLDEKWNLD